MNQGRLEQLMAYADGELSGNERLEVEVLLSTNEEARQFLAELGHLGGLVRAAWENGPEAKTVASFDVTTDVMKAIEAEKPAAAQVRSLDAAREKRAGKAGGGLRIGGAVVALLAAAAAVAVFARQPSETPVARSTPAITVPPSGAANAAQGGPGVEVEAVESPGSSVSVFHLPGASELSTSVVVWVEETGDKP